MHSQGFFPQPRGTFSCSRLAFIVVEVLMLTFQVWGSYIDNARGEIGVVPIQTQERTIDFIKDNHHQHLKEVGGRRRKREDHPGVVYKADDELIPTPPKEGKLTEVNPLGKLFSFKQDSNVTDYDAILVDLPEEEMSTPPTGDTKTGNVGVTAAPGGNNGSCRRPEVELEGGSLLGGILKVGSGEVYVFYGIPYAAPPINKLRFKRPFPPDPINGVVDAITIRPPCFPSSHQRTSTSAVYPKPGIDPNSVPVAKEDCLYLNIWLPSTVITKRMLPVLVWIHGEGFLSGMNQKDYETVAWFVKKTELIVVAIQYRLGAFGFLYMGVNEAPGNMGILDQIQGMKWIDENIEAFGGNSDAVTIIGHDIGAAFVGFHQLSKISPSFFKRAIMLGGAPSQPHVFKRREKAYQSSMDYAMELGCVNVNNSKAIVNCLLKQDAVGIWDIQSLIQTGNKALTYSFVPTNDGHVLDAPPLELLDNGKGKVIQILIGGTSNEGSNMLLNNVEGIRPDEPTPINQYKFQSIFGQVFRNFSQSGFAGILHEYKNWENLEDGFANQLKIADAFGDYFFTCPLRKFSDLWSARGLITYHYTFSHVKLTDSSKRPTPHKRPQWMGAVHGDELDFLFGVPLRLPDKFTPKELDLSRKAMKMLETFIKTGNPGIPWERYGRETPHYLDLGVPLTPSSTLSKQLLGPRLKACGFWNELFPLIRLRKTRES